MSFSAATALTRLSSGPVDAFRAGLSSAQKLQRLNEVLEKAYDEGTWRGLHDTLSPENGNGITTTGGIITLSSAYQRLDKLSVPAMALNVPIRDMLWAFSEGGPGNQDWTLYLQLIAIDQGDVSGVRKYQVTGSTTSVDAMAFSGLARKRFTYISNTADIIFPDCYNGLNLGVIAFGCRDERDNAGYAYYWGEALKAFNGNLAEFQPEMKQVVIQSSFGLRRSSFVH